MGNHPIDGMLGTTMEKIKEMVDVDSVIGKPITTPDGTTVIPISKVSYGFASGGSDFPAKSQPAKDFFGGGAGAGITITPIAFLSICNGDVKLIQVEPFEGSADRIIQMVPDVVDKISETFSKKKEERAAKKEEKKAAATSDGQPRGALPEGTVVGDGKIKYVLARIDSRQLHGQVATAWTKTTGPNRIIVVSDGVAHDDLRKSMIREAAPPGVKANVVPISKMIQVSKDTRFGNTKALLLFETPQDALAAIKGGVDIKELNIGSMAHSVGKVAVSKVLSLDEKDIETFEELKKLGVKFDVRKVPSDSQDNMDEILKKAKAELAK